jgi:DNA-binding response OmpR family regulator
MRILVVEPDAGVRHYLDMVLTRVGFHTLVASTAHEANALLLDFPAPPRLAFLDLAESASSCLAYGEDLRRRYPELEVIFMSSWQAAGTEELRQRGRLLYKPFYAQELLQTVRSVSQPR